MNILITGATGFIGKHLVNKLITEGHNISCTLIKDEFNPFGENVVTFQFWELNNNARIEFLIENKIDGIIHLASVFLSSHTINDIDKLVDSNIKFGTILLDLAVHSGITWFINTGTFWQHNNNKQYSPVNLYSATKQAFESIAEYYIEKNSISFVTLKLCDTYGPNDTRTKVFNLWKSISQSGERLEMTLGEQILDIVYIDDIINAYCLLLKLVVCRPIAFKNGISYAVRAEKRYSLKQLAKIFEQVTNTKLNIEWGAKPYRDQEVMIPWEHGELIPGWEPKTSIEMGIKQTFT